MKAPEVTGPRDVLVDIIALRQRIEQARDEARAATDVPGLGQTLDEVLRMTLDLEGRVRQSAVEVQLVEHPPDVGPVDLELLRLCATPGVPPQQVALAMELVMERTATDALRALVVDENLPESLRASAARAIERRVCAVPN